MRTIWLIGLLAVVLGAEGAWAAVPSILIDVPGGDPAQDVTGDGSFEGPNPSGETFWSLDDDQAILDGGGEVGFLDSWTATSTDRSVTNHVSITNTTGSDRVYVALVTLPVTGVAYEVILASSVGATVTDGNGDGLVQLAGDGAFPLYRGQVDGATVLSLDPGTPLTPGQCAPLANQDGCSATGTSNIGTLSASGTANEIAIVLRFSLSSGDSVGITSRFEIRSGVAAAAAPGGSGTALDTREAPPTLQESTVSASTAALGPGCHAVDDPDPSTNLRCYLTGRTNITNSLDFDILYVVTWLLNVPAFDYHSIAASSIGVSLLDNDGDGAMRLAQDGIHPFYQARVDGVPALALNPGAPLSTADCAPSASQPGCSATGSDNVGSLAAAGNANQLEITARFVLSAGDTVGITSRFELLPEPTAPWQLGSSIGMLALLAGLSRGRETCQAGASARVSRRARSGRQCASSVAQPRHASRASS